MTRPGLLAPLFPSLLSGCMATAEPPPAAQAEPQREPIIQVVAGSYGLNCKAPAANKTDHLRQACDGKPSCSYRVDVNAIGDPALGCAKEYLAEWRCGADPTVHKASAPPEAGYGKIVELRCD